MQQSWGQGSGPWHKSNHFDQYGRRKNIVLSRIPDDVTNNRLNSKVISLLSDIKVTVEPKDIENYHRIKKPHNANNPKETIIRFVNQMNCKKYLQNKEKTRLIQAKNLIDENLSHVNEDTPYNCSKFRCSDASHWCYSFNGNVYLKKTETETNTLKKGVLKSTYQKYTQSWENLYLL